MKRKIKVKSNFFLVLIIIASFFMSIGYAYINSVVLDINGSVSITTKRELHISNIEVLNENNGLGNVKLYDGTYFNSTTILAQEGGDSSVTYQVTVANNTVYAYRFSKVSYMLGTDTYDNENIVFELNGIDTETRLESGENITFTITFKYNDNVNITNNILNSGVRFIFKNLDAMKLSSLVRINETQLSNGSFVQFNNKEYFVGNNVNNYIWFNCQDGYTSGIDYCEKWRIISVEEDESIKIVKDDVVPLSQIASLESSTNFWRSNTSEWMTNTKILAAGKVIYDPKGRRPINTSLVDSYCINTNNGCNAYGSNQSIVGNYKNLNVDADSLIKLYLENVYYPYGLTESARGMIKESIYNVGLVGIGLNIDNVILAEKTATINSNVGLLNPSDFVIVSNDDNCKLEFTRYHTSSCKNTNWLILPDKQHIMMNGKVLNTDDKNAQIWTIRNDGVIVSQDANNEFYLRPVVYLNSNVEAIGLGISNEDDHYMLVS